MSEKQPNARESQEIQLVRAFLLPERQQLAHFKQIDMRRVVALPNNAHDAAHLLLLLKAKGAPDTCSAISEEDGPDGTRSFACGSAEDYVRARYSYVGVVPSGKTRVLCR